MWGNKPRHGTSGWAWQRTVAAILQRDGHRCRWCGGAATTADHVQAKAQGGSDDPANLVAACASCNEQRRRVQAIAGRRSRTRPAEQHPGEVRR